MQVLRLARKTGQTSLRMTDQIGLLTIAVYSGSGNGASTLKPSKSSRFQGATTLTIALTGHRISETAVAHPLNRNCGCFAAADAESSDTPAQVVF
jgi:hypothetical protein